MKYSDLIAESISDIGGGYNLVKSRYQNNQFLFTDAQCSSSFGKFLIRCIDTPTHVIGNDLRNIGEKILKKYNIPKNTSQYSDFSWDGSHLWTSKLDAEELFHEISHWVVSSSTYRKEKEFGLGAGFNTNVDLKSVRSKSDGIMEEYMAVILEVSWMRSVRGDWYSSIQQESLFSPIQADQLKLNLPTDIHISQFRMPNLNKFLYFNSAYSILKSYGLITNNGDPVWAVRIADFPKK